VDKSGARRQNRAQVIFGHWRIADYDRKLAYFRANKRLTSATSSRDSSTVSLVLKTSSFIWHCASNAQERLLRSKLGS
jgi:hypothetical protein